MDFELNRIIAYLVSKIEMLYIIVNKIARLLFPV